VSVVKKSQARIVWACEVRNWRQVGPARRGAGSTPAWFKDPPHGAGGEFVAQADQFSLNTAMTSGRILGGQPKDQVADLFGHGWPGEPGMRVGPCASDQAPAPTEQGSDPNPQVTIG
jgi:hypothetical protein